MSLALSVFIGLTFLGAVFVAATWGLSWRLVPEHRRGQQLRWLLAWSIKGLILPASLWAIMNIGLSWDLQPFMPQIQAAKNSGGEWFPEFLRVLGTGFFIVSSYWAAATLGWSVVNARVGLEGEARSDFKALCWTALLGMFLPATIIVLLGGWPTIGFAATVILTPLAGYAPSILQRKKMPPMYARAIANLNFGKYTEAEWEIINQLEKCEDDFEGWMMMAELYANHFHNMAEAEQTVLEVCDHPRTTTSELSVALQKLADWQLKFAQDPDAARRALRMICDRLPGTHLARMAQLRINQLPPTAEDLREQREHKPIPMPALGDTLDEESPPLDSELDYDAAVESATGCIEKLKQDPNNIATREKLARIFTERLHQAELGIEQITLLLNMSGQADAKRAEWLSLAAAWHIKYRHDPETGRNILEQLIREFPQSAQAFAARRRIRLMAARV